ncbi:LIM domain only protein 3-like isoform X1 [Leptopilina heterotoma]|uniref:LIM domain only protein 3-like isoform X1 n=1 Tax=Leptopilina heterotoma TaxID=63436 RepID=UPI001CA91474|nr:LIM domain only protein 3-like isoform X1 [Leptopilina heterotoma]
MTMDGIKTETNRNGATQQECAGCGKAITERYLLKALDMLWHEDCLKCGCCDCRLGEVGSTLYTKANLLLCKRDYLRLFGNTGHCAACSKVIPAFEMVMRARTNVYHLECFACQQCNHRFCVGDRFYLCDNKILCEYDYEERLVFANLALHPPPNATMAHIKRQVSHLQPPAVAGGGGGQRQVNGETVPGHNGYPVPTSSSGHTAINLINNNLNGINAQSTFEAK